MYKNVAKLTQKIVCLFLGTVMTFGMMFSVSYGMGNDINPMQKLILEAVNLDENARTDFADVLEEVTSSNYMDYVEDVSDIVSLRDEDITAALKAYANYDNTYKSGILLMLEQFELSEISAKDYTSFGFRRIQKMINFEVTGDYYDDRGIRLFVRIFKNLKELTGKSAFSDDTSDAYKLDIKVGSSVLENQIDSIIGNIQALESRNIKTFKAFVAYVEQVINSHANIEIYNFKRFLKSEDLGYSGALKKPTADNENVNLSPIQEFYLELISLSNIQRAKFVTDVLEKVDSGDLSGVRIIAQGFLGSMPSEDVNAALEAFASYSDENKETIKLALTLMGMYVEDEEYDTAKFNDIYERINFAITGNYDNEKGFMLFVKLLGTIEGFSSDNFIYDCDSDSYKINIDVSQLKLYQTFGPKIDVMIKAMDTLAARGIDSFDKYIVEMEAIVNSHPNDQIYNFKKFLDEEGLGYEGSLPNPAPTVEVTPIPTIKVTPTSLPSADPSATPTPVSTTPAPTNGNGNGNNGNGNNGGGSSNNASTATPKRTSTPVATEPAPTTVPGANPFSDLFDTHWAKGSIIELVTNKILTGYPDGTVKPDLQVTRAEMAVMIIKAAGIVPSEKPELKFKDSSEIGDWAAGYIQAAVEKKIIVGYEDNTFRPSNKLTREEMVVMVMKAYMYEAIEVAQFTFTDKGDIGSWSYGYIAKSVELKFVAGYPDNTFKPKKEVTRAEASTVINNCMKAAKGEKKDK